MNGRESHLVELVDDTGRPVGESTVDLAHRAPGRLHRAFSVLLVDGSGRLLLQQRASVKTRFALRWANACCGHPLPGEPVVASASRRLAEELGISGVPLREVGLYVYRAEDPASGRVEHEYDHVLLGRCEDPSEPIPFDPDEVAGVDWVAPDRVDAELGRSPDSYAPWLAGVLGAWRAASAR
jgi:isopentenyl-diphosphate delta-isomerase